MTIQVHWHNQIERIVLCSIIGSWSVSQLDSAYREMVQCARKTDDKIHIIFDLHQAHQPDVSDYRGLIPVSPFIASALMVFDSTSYESAEVLAQLILKVFDVPLDEAKSISEAESMIASLENA